MEKQISIVVAASGEIKDIAISPGATVREVLDEAGLQGYQLSKKDGEPLTFDTDLFNEAADSEKLYATPQDVSVGGGGSAPPSRFSAFIDALGNFIARKYIYGSNKQKESDDFRKRARITDSRPFRLSAQSRRVQFRGKRRYKKKEPKIIGIDREYPYWKENGWRKTGKLYKGYYKTDYIKCRGLIEENFRGNYSFYILNPPRILRNNFHWQCFSHKGDGKYSVHFTHKPKDISSGIIRVEQLIRESFEKEKGGEERWFSDDQELKEYILSQLKRI